MARRESAIRQYLKKIGSKGGKAGKGKAKARPSKLTRKAALKRWRSEPDGRQNRKTKKRVK